MLRGGKGENGPRRAGQLSARGIAVHFLQGVSAGKRRRVQGQTVDVLDLGFYLLDYGAI